MSAPQYKYLLVQPSDMGGLPLGDTSQVAAFDVSATFDREIRYSDGSFKAGGIPLSDYQPWGGGGVLIKVPLADDPEILSGTGFAITVSITYSVTTEQGKRQPQARTISTLLAMVDLPASDPTNTTGLDIIYLSTRGDAVPVPQEYVDSATIRSATDAAVSTANQASATAISAVATANSATTTANDAMAIAQTTIAPTDNQVQALVNNNSSNTSSALNDVVKPRTPGSTAGLTPNTTLLQRIRGHAGILATEWGVKGDASINDGPMLQTLSTAAADAQTRVLLSPGRYALGADGLAIASGSRIEALTGQKALYYGPSSWNGKKGTVVFEYASGVTSNSAPMLKVAGGGGVTLSGFTCYGRNVTSEFDYPLLEVDMGFESIFRDMRFIQHRSSTAVKFQGLQNCVVEDMHVNYCGTSTQAAVMIDGSPTQSSYGATNFLPARNLTIESSYGPALDVGMNDAAYAAVEFLRLNDLHVENPHPDVKSSYTGPSVRIGNVWGMTFNNPFIYASNTGPAISHMDTRTTGNNTSGYAQRVQMLGGQIVGGKSADGTSGAYAIDLQNGRGFCSIGTEFHRWTTAAVRAGSGYGSDVMVLPAVAMNESGSRIPALTDNRTGATKHPQIRTTSSTTGQIATNVTLTSSNQDLASVTFTAGYAGTMVVRFDALLTYATANDVILTQLVVNGSAIQGDLVYSSSSTGRVPIGREWRVPATAATSYTIKAWAKVATGSGASHVVAQLGSLSVDYHTTN